MKRATQFRFVFAMGLATALIGCSDSQGKRLWSHDEITDIADDAIDDRELEKPTVAGSSDLEARLQALEDQNRELARLLAAVSEREAGNFEASREGYLQNRQRIDEIERRLR